MLYKCEPWEKIKKLTDENEGWITSRLMNDGCCNIIYEVIGNKKDGYYGFASNNAYGFERVAVVRKGIKARNFGYLFNGYGSKYKNPYKLMSRIERGTQLWLCTGYCNCIGEYTKTITN